ncbi:MAG: hypothetical protein GY925_23420, partial [Actinomycetia bacterium]|nr:hypothetical protein [Actinomycetes bacterium]
MTRRHLFLIFVTVATLAATFFWPTSPVRAAVTDPPIEYFASDAATHDSLGFAIAVDGSTAVVGAPGTTNSGKPGKVYVFQFSGGIWTESATVTAPTPIANEGFGYAVDIDGNSIIVGVRDEDAGRAYVFTGAGSSWSHEVTLTPSSGVAGSFFGRAVNLEGDRALIGASGHDDVGPNHGAAFVYERTGTSWSETIKLTSGNPSVNGLFGDAVLLDGGRALVGAPIERSGGFALAGSVYEFDLTTGALTQTIEPPDRQAFHGFGTAIAVDDDSTLVIGANGDRGPTGFDPTCSGSSTAVCNPGSIYVYDDTPSGAVLAAELHAPDLGAINNYSPGAQFGLEVAIVDGRIVVGARYSDDVTLSAGRVYIFDRSNGIWNETASVTPADARPGDLFGNNVAVGPDDQILAGAPNDDSVNQVWTPNEGSFSTVSVSRPDPGDTAISIPQSDGNVGYYTSLVLDSQGHPVVSHHDLTNRDLDLVHCDDPDCVGAGESITSPDTAGAVGSYTSLALDAQGHPVVSYYDESSDDLNVLHCNDP